MVSHSHLSNGNSVSSVSHDLSAEFGVSRPNSPSISSPLVLSIEDMVESVAMPHPISCRSDDSSSLGKDLVVDVGHALSTEARDIFKAVHYFSRKDRAEALAEREKILKLQNFISAHGFSVEDVNSFIVEGKLATKDIARQVFEKIPPGPTAPFGTRAGSPPPRSPFGSHLVPISCVGDDLLPERGLYSPTSSSLVGPEGQKPGSFSKIQNSNLNSCSDSISAEIKSPRQLAGPSKSWSNIVSRKSEKAAVSLSFFPPSSLEGSILIKPPVEVLKRGNQIWSTSLVGYFLHSKLPFKVVEPIARRLWGNMGISKVILHSKGYYIFKFQTAADMDNVLASGPWHFASKVVVLKPWKEGVEFAKADCDKFPIWVKLSNIPLSY